MIFSARPGRYRSARFGTRRLRPPPLRSPTRRGGPLPQYPLAPRTVPVRTPPVSAAGTKRIFARAWPVRRFPFVVRSTRHFRFLFKKLFHSAAGRTERARARPPPSSLIYGRLCTRRPYTRDFRARTVARASLGPRTTFARMAAVPGRSQSAPEYLKKRVFLRQPPSLFRSFVRRRSNIKTARLSGSSSFGSRAEYCAFRQDRRRTCRIPSESLTGGRSGGETDLRLNKKIEQ